VIEILSATALASVQDLGRDGYLRYGVGTSGAMDRLALSVANILLGNPENSAAIEIPMFPFQVRFLEDIAFALTGADADAELDGRAVPPWWTLQARKGQVLSLGAPKYGARCYLAVAGGIDVPLVLGSRSTQLRGEFGGHAGRTLRQGDVLGAISSLERSELFKAIPAAGLGVEPPDFALALGDQESAAQTTRTFVRVLPAAEYDCYEDASLQSFWNQDWKITSQSDRYGYRLAGEALVTKQTLEQRSHGIVPGVIQVPHSGQPIIQLRDAQPSGGYPKIGTVIEADMWRLGQARPGTQLRFVQTSYDDALAALDAVRNYLDKVARLVELYLLSKR
jgi:5-oxoprolinase (ATP-hydrolysing) subunit C